MTDDRLQRMLECVASIQEARSYRGPEAILATLGECDQWEELMRLWDEAKTSSASGGYSGAAVGSGQNGIQPDGGTSLDILPFAKPKDREGKITLTAKERRDLKNRLFMEQKGRCCTCGCHMTLSAGFPFTATLDHITPQPAGCKKDDRRDNLRALCWRCNSLKGSKRNNTR